MTLETEQLEMPEEQENSYFKSLILLEGAYIPSTIRPKPTGTEIY
jgi:hypothetical protein